MKFLCDRCKTRYSIGDDRVRGKILKIRCKNCANVITVREGMPGVDDASAADPNGGAPRRTGKSTTQAPLPQDAPAAGSALGAAFASAMTKPPPALEEEWYVSIDGDQQGPFSLAEAQRWVGSRPFDAELHCWSEGFDDWLPVDKVSHFRGLRKKPLPPAGPPPLPRVGGAASRPVMAAAAPAPVEEEPKPLFAATMASLEKATGSTTAMGLPPIAATVRPSATPPKGQPSLDRPTPVPRPTPLPSALKTNGAARPAALPAATPASRKTPLPNLAPTTPKPGATPAKLFDSSEALESLTSIDSQPFEDDQRTAAEPVASARRDARPVGTNDAFFDARAAEALAPTTVDDGPDPAAPEDHDGLDIGEVSRVVKLADLARTPRTSASRRSGPLPSATTTGIGRATASVPRLGGTSSPNIPLNPLAPIGADGQVNSQVLDPHALGDPAAGDHAHDLAAHAPPAISHRRGMIALLVGAVSLLALSIVIVMVVVNKDQVTNNSLGGDYSFDPSRPDDMRPRNDQTTGPTNPNPPQNPFVPKKRPNVPNVPNNTPPPPTGNSLRAEEIEQMAAKYSSTTQRCYMSSMKGVDLISIGDVKKLTVTLSVQPDGSVNNVMLSDKHETNKLGKCLINTITRWKFRTSPGGTFRFVIHFG